MDLFVNIFQILGPNCKILGLRVDFGKTEGPKCKMSEIPGITNFFQRIKAWTGSTHGEPAGRAQSTVDRRRHGPWVPKRGGALTGVRPPAAPVHQSSPVGAQKRERSTGSSARASMLLGRRRGDRATAVARRCYGKLGGEGFRRGRGEENGAVRCGVLRGSSGWL
jgi:hypothetical protein